MQDGTARCLSRTTNASLDFVDGGVLLRGLLLFKNFAEGEPTDTVSILDNFGVDRCRTTVHNWMRKTDLQPKDGKNPNHVALDET